MKAQFNQLQSNLIYFCKHWYQEPEKSRTDIILSVVQSHYGCGDDPAGAYHFFRDIWLKILAVMGERTEWFLNRYDELSMPSKTWQVGGQKFGVWHNPETDKFNDEELIWARVLAMVSQIALTEVKYLETMTPTDFCGLKLKPNIVEKQFKNKVDGE